MPADMPEAAAAEPALTDFTRSDAKLAELRELVASIVTDPLQRHQIIWAAIDYGELRADESITAMETAWQRSIDRRSAA